MLFYEMFQHVHYEMFHALHYLNKQKNLSQSVDQHNGVRATS